MRCCSRVRLVARFVGELARCLELRLLFVELARGAMPTRCASSLPLAGDPVQVVAAFDEVARTVGAPDQVEHRAAVRTLVEQHRAAARRCLRFLELLLGLRRSGSTSGTRRPRAVGVGLRLGEAVVGVGELAGELPGSTPGAPGAGSGCRSSSFSAASISVGVLGLLLADVAELVALLGRGAWPRAAP